MRGSFRAPGTDQRAVALILTMLVLAAACTTQATAGSDADGTAAAPAGADTAGSAGSSGTADGAEEDFAAGYVRVAGAFQRDTDAVKARGADALAAGDQAAVAEVYGSLREVTASAAESFSALRAPAALQDDLDAVSSSLRSQVAALDQVLAGIDGDEADPTSVTAGLQAFAEAIADFSIAHQQLTDALGVPADPGS